MPDLGLDPDIALQRNAVAVLRSNWELGYTVPSRRLYPHQWSWDSAFIAIGWARVAPGRARQELESLLAAQWADGRVPQIVFNPDTPRDAYFPGPDFWRSPTVPGAPRLETSGLVQPPLHARAALEVYRADPGAGRGFLARVYPRLCAQHDYLRRERGDSGGLAVIVHPWESGLDNSPSWDAELDGVSTRPEVRAERRDLDHADPGERPTDRDYARYITLAERYRDHGYRDASALPEHPFVMVDPLFNALLGWSDEALAEIADVLGEPSEPHRRHAVEVRDALLARHYDPAAGHFFAAGGRRDGRGRAEQPRGDHSPAEHTVGGLVPLVLDLPGDVVEALVRTAAGPRFALNDRVPLPSYDLTGAAFDPTRYWRGPAWVNTSWLILRGLRRHGRHAEATSLRAALLAATRQGGFREYYHPLGGAGHGSTDFSWSAALTLDVLAESPSPAHAVSAGDGLSAESSPAESSPADSRTAQ
ncbi:MAG: MGH1-like glycoside hydrolase domain-containing protein [Pseudonocardia sp.]